MAELSMLRLKMMAAEREVVELRQRYLDMLYCDRRKAKKLAVEWKAALDKYYELACQETALTLALTEEEGVS